MKTILLVFLLTATSFSYGQTKKKEEIKAASPTKADSIISIPLDSMHMVWMYEALSAGMGAWDGRTDMLASDATDRKKYIALVIQFVGQNYNKLYPQKQAAKKP